MFSYKTSSIEFSSRKALEIRTKNYDASVVIAKDLSLEQILSNFALYYNYNYNYNYNYD